MILNLVYRPHNLYGEKAKERAEQNNIQLCEIVRDCQGSSVILGDFNYSDISWDYLTAANKNSREFLEATQEGFLTQHVDFPTRVESMTMPDLVLSSV